MRSGILSLGLGAEKESAEGGREPRACLVHPEIQKILHQILRHMHDALNIDKNKN